MATPDAIMIEKTKKAGNTMLERIDSTLAIAEPLLGIDRSKGERAHIRVQSGGREFITADPKDTILYPTVHPLATKPRYNWVASTNDPDIFLGYLKDKPAPVASGDVIVTPGTIQGEGVMKGAV